MSIEYSALSHYTGEDPAAVNPVFEQLLATSPPATPRCVRIGGNSSDSTWWPVPGMTKPKGINYTLTRRWLALARALATDTGAKLILGVDLALGGPPLAATEARALLHGVGTRHVQALEIGNEPKRYALFPWYRNAAGKLVYIRPRDYGFTDFSRRLRPRGRGHAGRGATRRAHLRRHDLDVGPAHVPDPGAPGAHRHRPHLSAQPLLDAARASPEYPTMPRLLSTFSSRHLVAGLPRYIALAHRSGDVFRVDEMQSVACGGKVGIRTPSRLALWAMDTLFSMARARRRRRQPAHLRQGRLRAVSLPPHRRRVGRHPVARVLRAGHVRARRAGRVAAAGAAPQRQPRHADWATRGRDGTVRVLLINDSLTRGHTVSLRSRSAARRRSPASVPRASAATVRGHARRRVSLTPPPAGSGTCAARS